MRKLILIITIFALTTGCSLKRVNTHKKYLQSIKYEYDGGKMYKSYLFTKDLVKQEGTTESSTINSPKQWSELTKTVDIEHLITIKNKKNVSASCGKNTTIELTFDNDKKIKVLNAHDDKIWGNVVNEIKTQIHKINSQ